MELMARYPDNYFDLAIVDPPYGIGASKPSNKKGFVTQKNGSKTFIEDAGYKQKDWDDFSPDIEYFNELVRVSKNQIIWGYNYYKLTLGVGRIIWDKVNDHMDQNDCEIAYYSGNNRQDICRYMWAGFMQGEKAGGTSRDSVLQIGNKKLNEIRIHPTQKPVKLYEWLLSKYANEGDKILDTHLGSGSIAIACHNMKYDLTACELDKDYFEAANERIELHKQQGQLF
jgi:site-specific DNA-methyltransferase (adenine-specific)